MLEEPCPMNDIAVPQSILLGIVIAIRLVLLRPWARLLCNTNRLKMRSARLKLITRVPISLKSAFAQDSE